MTVVWILLVYVFLCLVYCICKMSSAADRQMRKEYTRMMEGKPYDPFD